MVPMEDINLHFTGDFNALALANNLLAAMIDNHIHHGNELGFDLRRITWKRDHRHERPRTEGYRGRDWAVRRMAFHGKDSFDLVAASEVMAIFCLATSLSDLKNRLGNIVAGYTLREQKPITARDLKAHGAMAVPVEKRRTEAESGTDARE